MAIRNGLLSDLQLRHWVKAGERNKEAPFRPFAQGLKAELDRYAAPHAHTYGEAVDAATLIPHMLEAFMAGDRGFRKSSEKRIAFPSTSRPPASGQR